MLRGHAVGLHQGKVLIRKLNAYETPTLVQMAPIIDGKPDVTKISAIDLEELRKKFRWQKIVFEQASQVYDQMRPGWKGNKE